MMSLPFDLILASLLARKRMSTSTAAPRFYDRRHVTFMYSYPNYIPMKPSDVRDIRERLDGLEFDDAYGYTWGLNIIGGARSAVNASFDRYLDAVS
jgi:hypothetical protein